jgi:general secretion pathway protein J
MNPIARPRSTHQRVAYLLEEDRLVRLSWVVLDPAPDSEPVRQVLLEGVTRFEIRLLSSDDAWVDRWPLSDPSGSGTQGTSNASLPRAAEVSIELEDWGEVRWLIEMVGG